MTVLDKVEEERKRAGRLSEAANPLPSESDTLYVGPEPFGQGVVRGSVFATLGWFAGNAIGSIGTKTQKLPDGSANPKYHSFKPRNFGALFAFVGGVMGAYGGAKNARLYQKQVEELQAIVKEQHDNSHELQMALHRQLQEMEDNVPQEKVARRPAKDVAIKQTTHEGTLGASVEAEKTLS